MQEKDSWKCTALSSLIPIGWTKDPHGGMFAGQWDLVKRAQRRGWEASKDLTEMVEEKDYEYFVPCDESREVGGKWEQKSLQQQQQPVWKIIKKKEQNRHLGVTIKRIAKDHTILQG